MRSPPCTRKARGVPKDDERGRAPAGAPRALVDHLDAQVEYAIALYNGTGVDKNESRRPSPAAKRPRGAATRSRRTGSPASTPPAAGLPADPVEAVQWHLISKAAGASDPFLDEFMQKQTRRDARQPPQKNAKPWLDLIAASRP